MRVRVGRLMLEANVWWFVGKMVVVACRDWFELYKAFLSIGIKVGLWTSLLHLQRWFLQVGRWLRIVCATPFAFATRTRWVQYERDIRSAPGFGLSTDLEMCFIAAVNSGCMVPPSSMGRGRIWISLAMEMVSQSLCFRREPWLAA